ncbi:twin-arginine protein translocase subunit TatA/E homolog [Streptomyces sp. NBRC 110611]|nr:twin-arginine protein translocase subunit TatA/E homolog [Streptomyces sp. NBRC 110611]
MLGFSEVALILIVVVLLLGAKKLPELARSAGKAARILKSEAKAMKSDGEGQSPASRVAPGGTGTVPPARTEATPGSDDRR